MNTKALRQKVLDLAIHGKLVPQNPNDESATVLLEKIRAEKAEKIKKGEIKADKKDSFIFEGSDKRHYEQFADGSVKDIEDEIPFEVPEGWTWCRLGEVCELKGGKRIPAGLSATKEKTNHIYIRVTDMQNNSISDADLVYITDEIFEKIQRYTINKDDLYLTIAGTIGRVGEVPEIFDGMNLTENALKLTNISICKKYLMQIINTKLVQDYFESTYHQVAMPKLSLINASKTIIPLPPLAEQERIVSVIKSIFSQIDTLDQNKSDLQTAIKQTKSKILDLAIHGKLVPQDPNDEPAEELLKRIATSDNRPYEKVEEEPFEIPDSWKWVKLVDIGQTNIGLTYHPNDISNTGIIVLRSNNIQNDKLCFDDIVKVNSNTKILNNQYINNGDILICARNGSQSLVGKCVLLNNLKEKTSFGAFMAVFRSNYNRYILKYLQSKYFKDYMFESNSTQIHQLTQSMLKDALIPFPPEKEQVRIVAKIDELYSRLDQIQNNLV